MQKTARFSFNKKAHFLWLTRYNYVYIYVCGLEILSLLELNIKIL